ncbi:hypothetical protein GTQ40_02020 [Flavobacteriaceae bacterium R38]|nr:hypothetical protein [Flavobacteriaceae bacterium R38]
MDSKEQFLEIIRKKYLDLTQEQVPFDLVDEVSNNITDYYYDQYQRFIKQYPKSVKRYSSFQIKDLDHPITHETIIKILKEKVDTDYEKYAILFLNMTLEELKKFERNREEFYKMF